jgi:hypothetical protein
LFNAIKKFISKYLPDNRKLTTTGIPQTIVGLKESFELTVEYLSAFKVIKITANGLLTMEANNQIVATVLTAISQYGTHRVLIDDRNIILMMKIANIYDLPQINQQLGIDKNIRVALLYTPSEEMDKLFKFYENRTYNRYQRVFTDECKALNWLSEVNNLEQTNSP